MSSGQKAMWDRIEEENMERHKAEFLAASSQHLQLIDRAISDLERLVQSDPALTRYQHNLVDDALQQLKGCFKK